MLPFGDVLSSLRNERNLTQTQLAEAIHRSTSFISLLESGQRRPARELIDALADALGLEPDSENRGALLRAAGFEPRELSGAIARVVDILAEQTPISESHKIIVRSDLNAFIDGWLRHAKLRLHFDQGNFNEVAAQSEEMLQQRHFSPTLLTSVRMTLAETMVQEGELSRAETLITEATTDVDAGQVAPEWTPTLRAELRALQGLIFLHNGNYSSAKMLIEQTVGMYHQLLTSGRISDDIGYLGLGVNYKRLAQIAILQGEPGNGFTFCMTAESYLLRANESAERTHWLLRVAEQKAWAYTKLGDFPRAIRLRLQTHEALQRAHDDYGAIRNWLYTGDDYLSPLKLAVKQALSAAFPDAAAPMDLQRRTAAIRDALTTSEARVWLSHAEQSYQQALEGLEKYGQNMLIGRCLSNLATVLRFRSIRDNNATAAEQAQVYLGRALTLEQGIRQRRRLPGIYETLGDLELDHGNLTSAKQFYNDGLQALDAYQVDSNDTAARAQRERLKSAQQAVEVLLAEEARNRPPGVFLVSYPQAPSASEARWQELCKQLLELTQEQILSRTAALVAFSNKEDTWVEKLCAFDAEDGGRKLLQDTLSDSLTVKLGAGLSPTGASTHEKRHNVFRLAIQRAHTEDDLSIDLCCRPHIEHGLRYPDTSELMRQQIRNAYEFMTTWKQGYRLESSIYSVPMGFAVKRSHVLIEIPARSASRFLGPEKLTQHVGATLCYEFKDDEEFARKLRDLFHEFLSVAVSASECPPRQESTVDWLKRLLEPPVIITGLTGGGMSGTWSLSAG